MNKGAVRRLRSATTLKCKKGRIYRVKYRVTILLNYDNIGVVDKMLAISYGIKLLTFNVVN